jgi:hypothetical protein
VAESKDVKFLLIGYGPLKEILMQLALDYGILGKNFFFTGPLCRDEIANFR